MATAPVVAIQYFIMTEKQVLRWIKKELAVSILKAIAQTKITRYSESVLAGIACRETAIIIAKNAGKMTMEQVSSVTRGDFTKRKNDIEARYHGYSFWQIDIDSFPDFIKSGSWKDPVKACVKAIQVLEEKRSYILSKNPKMKDPELLRATIAAYNCGQGRVVQLLASKQDVDSATTKGDYSKCVLAYADCYATL